MLLYPHENSLALLSCVAHLDRSYAHSVWLRADIDPLYNQT
jgi:hypothetical protein